MREALMNPSNVIGTEPPGIAAGSRPAGILPGWQRRSWEPLFDFCGLYWALFALSIGCFCISTLWGPALGPFAVAVAVLGASPCGFAWLLARSLFRSLSKEKFWPLAVVTVLFLTAGFFELTGGEARENELLKSSLHILGNILALTSSTVLLLTLIEPLEGLGRAMPAGERRFRFAFAAGYCALAGTAVLWGGQFHDAALSPDRADMINVTCALLALGAATVATAFRLARPLPASGGGGTRKVRTLSAADHALARRIVKLIQDRRVHGQAELKVADLAAMLSEPDYKVTQCITGVLGFQNFNRLINHYRIERAKELLDDPAFADRSILSVAMECGFGSIGPFNRAFKQETGMTPGHYRSRARGAA